MIYLESFSFPSESQETAFLHPKDKTPEEVKNMVKKDFRTRFHYGSVYPFEVLSPNGMYGASFDEITIFCGGNGCGKTTVLNVIAEKLGLKRDSLFNSGRFLQDYLNLCAYESHLGEDGYWREVKGKEMGICVPVDSRIIVSDDVFAHSMKQRQVNDQIIRNRPEVERELDAIAHSNSHLQSLADYDRWAARNDALKNQSAFIRKKLGEEAQEHSNGETAMLYFLERMENPGLYLLDEPENSLSLENQKMLAEYIVNSARFFKCQFIIATHSPVFLSIKGARIYDMDENPVVTKKWTDVENVRVMYDFFKIHEAEFDKGV